MSAAWQCFTTDYEDVPTRRRLVELHDETCKCIQRYGKYFQTCIFHLHAFDFDVMELDTLELLVQYGINIKSLKLYHPHCFAFSQPLSLERYTKLLSKIMKQLEYLHSFSLFNLNYLAMNQSKGAQELFDQFIRNGIHLKLTQMEFSHAYDFSQPLHLLSKFENLTHLKCPVQVLTTDIIHMLGKNCMKHLYLVNDASTLNEEYNECDNIDWNTLSEVIPHLQVHYIFRERVLRPRALNANPLTVSFVLDSLCNQVSSELIETVIDLYGESLQTFGHLATQWNFEPYEDLYAVPNMYCDLSERCAKLKSFACGVDLPAVTLLLICENRPLSSLLINADFLVFDMGLELLSLLGLNLCDMPCHDGESLNAAVSSLLGYNWHALPSEEFMRKTENLLHF